jgi:hypothetical protein
MINICNNLVPKAVEYGAGLLKNFFKAVTSNNEKKHISIDYYLMQNYPNPFNPSTAIKFSLPKATHVTLSIYNTLGQEVSNLVSKDMNAGVYTAEWNASSFASGVYFYRIQAGSFVETKKMVLLK